MGIFTHRLALCESEQVGDGTRVWAFAHVMSGAIVGRDCNIGDHAFIESGAKLGDRVTVKNGVLIWDGVTIGDDVFVGPGVLFTNDRTPRSGRMPEVAARYASAANWRVQSMICRGASLGAGAVILPGVTVGEHAMVGAGAVVTRDVGAHQLVVGNPARVVGQVCICGGRLDDSESCMVCGKRLELKLNAEQFQSTLPRVRKSA